jgi:hypothetical protein
VPDKVLTITVKDFTAAWDKTSYSAASATCVPLLCPSHR